MKLRQLIPNFCTTLSLIAGVLAIIVTLDGRFALAAQLIMAAMILDGIDGNLARLLRTASDFGSEMDTFVDLTAFGLAPAILFHETALPCEDFWRGFVAIAIVLSGVLRLSRFKVKNVSHGQHGYCGLPITVNAGWIAVCVFLCHTERFGPFSISMGPGGVLFVAGTVAMTILQVSNVRYPKPTKNFWIFIPCVVLVLFFSVGLLGLSVPAAVAILVLGLSYLLLGPLVTLRAVRAASRADAEAPVSPAPATGEQS